MGDIINKAPETPKFDGDPYTVATRYLDKIFHLIPAYNGFTIVDIIQSAELPPKERIIAEYLHDKLEYILKTEGCLEQHSHYGNLVLQLNSHGRNVQQAGGLTAYKKQRLAIRTNEKIRDAAPEGFVHQKFEANDNSKSAKVSQQTIINMTKPRIFIGSSTEGLEIANAIHHNLDRFAEVTIWSQGLFKLSLPIITNLMNSLKNFDFAIFVFSSDDVLNLRGSKFSAVRDNVIFETGLFAGKLGIDKVFFLKPRNQEDLRLPTDLLGVITGEYDANRADRNLVAATGPFCVQVQKQISEVIVNSTSETKKFGNSEIHNDPDLQILFAYMFSRNLTAISFEKLKENVHPKFTEDYVMKIMERHPLLIRQSKLKNSKPGIKILVKQDA